MVSVRRALSRLVGSYRVFTIMGVAVCALLCSVGSYAQSGSHTGRLEGIVSDQSGAAVSGAEITVRNEVSGAEQIKESDGSGSFTFLNLEPGQYQVSVLKQGFDQVLLSQVWVSVGTTATLRPKLTLSSGDAATVDISVARSETQGSAVSMLDSTTSASSTAIGERSIELLPLNGRNFTDFSLLSTGAATDGDFGLISFHGISGNYNNYTVDGANDNNAFYAQQIGRTSIPFQFSQDVIQEFQVTSSGFESEFGQAGGGLVNTVTKSGGNEFHGDGYYYFLDSALSANDSINKRNGIAKPPNRRQQFGATVSGPIVKDKLFYVANYEGQARNEPLIVNDAPALVGLPTGFFAANPALQQSVSSAAGSFSRSFNQNTGFVKVQGSVGDKNTFTATYNYQRFRSPHGYFNTPTSTGDGLSLTDGSTSHFAQFSLQTFFNATTVNELLLHVGKDAHFDMPESPATLPAITIQNPDSGFVFGGNRFQLSTADRRYQVRDGLTKVLGRHTIKIGADFNVNHERDYFVYGPKGEYRFADLASVATGAFELYLQSFGQTTAKYTSPSYAFFAQDEYRVNSRLNLNYGLRYDLQVLPQPETCNPAFTLTCRIPYSRANIAPRAGFAFAIDPERKTVLRGSFGMFYVPENLLDVAQATLSNGISRQFLATTGPGFGNSNPIVAFPNSLAAFPAGAGGTPSLIVFSPNFRSPYVEQGNIGLERQIGKHAVVSTAYVYTHGLALLGNSNGVTRQANGNFGFDLNLVSPGMQGLFGGTTTTDTVILPDGKSYVVPDFQAMDGALNPNFGAINAIDNSGKSIYHGLDTSFRYSSAQFIGLASYTFSKTIDQGTGYYNQFDQRSQRGLSQLDQRHKLVLSGAWSPALPFLKGFTFGSVGAFASGRPYTAVFDTPQLNFSMVPGVGYNSFRGPAVQDIDFSIARAFKINERTRLRFAVEAFDLFNHANYQQTAIDNVQYTTQQSTDGLGNPIWLATGNPHFGQPLASAPRYGSRNFQFSARINF